MSFLSDLLGPSKAFDGGLYLPEHKADIARRLVETIRPAGPLFVPLQPTRELETRPVVDVARRVLRGERLAEPVSNHAIPAFAPTSGLVTRLDRAWTPRDGFLPCAVLEPDGRNEALPRRQGWQDESIILQLATGGVLCPQTRTPLFALIQRAVAAGVTDLIVNAMETEPYLVADLRTLVEEHGRIVDCACELADALGVSRAILAVPYRHRRVVARLEAEAAGRYLQIAPLANAYPQCHPHLLVKVLLEREIAPGDTPFDVRAMVLPLAAVRQAADALVDDRPVTDALVTIAGDAVGRPGAYRVPVGTPVSRLVEHVGLLAPVAKAVCGGPLTGVALGHPDAVVTADTSALLFFAADPLPEPEPCIHCGWCIEDCPVGIDPPHLSQLEALADCDPVQHAHLHACVDCGLCSFVCPAQLPLAETLKRTRARFDRRPEAAP